MKKRILPVLIMAIAFVLAFTACSGDKATNGNITGGNITDSNAADDNTNEPTVQQENEAGATSFGEFETVDVEGNTVDHTAFQGKKLTMVNVWATFCSPCINEMPDLEKISKEYADKGFQIVGVVLDVTQNSDGSYNQELLTQAEAVIEQTGVTYLNLLMSDDLMNTELGELYSIPTTYFLDENGKQLGESYLGSRSYEDWCQLIDDYLAS